MAMNLCISLESRVMTLKNSRQLALHSHLGSLKLWKCFCSQNFLHKYYNARDLHNYLNLKA